MQTLNGAYKINELIALAAATRQEVVCIQEHRFIHIEGLKYHQYNNGWVLIIGSGWLKSQNASQGGVGILMSPNAYKSINNAVCSSEPIIAPTHYADDKIAEDF